MGEIKATVLGFRDGLKSYEDVDLIRIISDRYNIMILKDFMPMIGELKGRIEIVSGDELYLFHQAEGFFIHKNNEFELLLTEDDYVE